MMLAHTKCILMDQGMSSRCLNNWQNNFIFFKLSIKVSLWDIYRYDMLWALQRLVYTNLHANKTPWECDLGHVWFLYLCFPWALWAQARIHPAGPTPRWTPASIQSLRNLHSHISVYRSLNRASFPLPHWWWGGWGWGWRLEFTEPDPDQLEKESPPVCSDIKYRCWAEGDRVWKSLWDKPREEMK